MINLDKELVDKIKGLTLEFKDVPQPELLIAIPNRFNGVDSVITIETSEFTSLCPLNLTQPDYAKIIIDYRPNYKLVELKSLKLYLVSFRMVPIFHEQVTPTILENLVELLYPDWVTVTGLFTTRGGLDTTVESNWEMTETLARKLSSEGKLDGN